MIEVEKVFHIVSNTVQTVTGKTGYLGAVVFSVVDTGSSWTVGVRDKQTTPMYAVPPVAASPNVDAGGRAFWPQKPMLMQGGIDIVPAGGTPGIVDVWIWYWTNP